MCGVTAESHTDVPPAGSYDTPAPTIRPAERQRPAGRRITVHSCAYAVGVRDYDWNLLARSTSLSGTGDATDLGAGLLCRRRAYGGF